MRCLLIGMPVICSDGTLGIIEYVTLDGWYGVRQGRRLDEWQGPQLTGF